MKRLLTLAALISATAPAHAWTAQPNKSVVGWWRATINHNGSTDGLYLHLQSHGDANLASFSAPSIGTSDTAAGSFSVSGSQVKLADVGWTLERNRDGTLRGVLPKALVPVYDIKAIFHRSSAPRGQNAAPVRRGPETPLWRREMGAAIFGDIAYDPRRRHIIVGTVAGELRSLDARTGETAWSITLGSPIRSAPTVMDGAILVATDSQALKLDAQTGQI